jgi:hypothetical protein
MRMCGTFLESQESFWAVPAERPQQIDSRQGVPMSILIFANDCVMSAGRSHWNRRVGAMKYLLMCCHEEKELDAMPKSECDAVMEETMAYCEALKKSGHLIAVEQLEPVQTAMTVRVRNGKLSATDGPFAETKEQVGGFFLINAQDLNEAIQVASKFPAVRFGTMEVRPVMEQPGRNRAGEAG